MNKRDNRDVPHKKKTPSPVVPNAGPVICGDDTIWCDRTSVS